MTRDRHPMQAYYTNVQGQLGIKGQGPSVTYVNWCQQ